MFNPVLDRLPALRVHLCGDEVVIVTIDPRTGRINLRNTGDLAAAGRGPRFAMLAEKLAENPAVVVDALMRLRLKVSLFSFPCLLERVVDAGTWKTIADLARHKANYLGLRSFAHRNVTKEGTLSPNVMLAKCFN